MKVILILSLITVSWCVKFKSPSNEITQKNLDLFKYSPIDEYTLPEDIDDDKPPINFVGNVMQAKTLVLENKNHGKGKFKYSVETQNGITVTQVGKLKDEKTFVISGSYSYTGADGRRYKVKYTADELGYHPITELDLEIPELINKEKTNHINQIKQNIETEEKLSNEKEGYIYSNPDDQFYLYPRPSFELVAPRR